MKEVSVGNKSKADVLSTCLQQMKACFLDVRLELNLFSQIPKHALTLKFYRIKCIMKLFLSLSRKMYFKAYI